MHFFRLAFQAYAVAFVLLISSFAGTANAQTVTATLTVNYMPETIALNPVTNKLYVFGNGGGLLTVIDGATNTTTSLPIVAVAAAVNPVTNKIYVSDANDNNVTVIDGFSNNMTTVVIGSRPGPIAVNPATNQIYVLEPAAITVIDGVTNNTTSIANSSYPRGIAVNPVTNKIYVSNGYGGNVIVIDGATNTITTTVAADQGPNLVVVNPVTNKIYVANDGVALQGTVTVIDGATNSAVNVPLTPGGTPGPMALNPITNKVYIANFETGDLTAIDGLTNQVTNTSIPSLPYGGLAVNPVTNQICLTSQNNATLMIIDGVSGNTKTLTVGRTPLGVVVNPVTNKIYTANSQDRTVSVIDGSAYSAVNITSAVAPFSVAVNPVTGKIYAATGANSVTVIDGVSNTTSTVNAGTAATGPNAIAVNPVTNKIYVANGGSANVTVIDGSTNNTAAVAAGSNPCAVAVNPVTNKIYVANSGSSNVTVIDGVSNSTTTVPAGAQPCALAVNVVTNKIYVANYQSNNITVVDGASSTATTFAAGTGPCSVAVNPATNKIYVANQGSSNVTVIEGVSGNTTVVSVGSSPVSIAVNPVTNTVYVANQAGNTVTVINGETNATAQITLPSGSSPAYVSVNQTTNKIYVAGSGLNRVTVIDGATNSATAVATGSSPAAIAVNPVTNKIYTANLGASDVTVISESPVAAIPLTTAITSLPNNQTTSVNPSFTFTASSATAAIPEAVYFQVDSWQNGWNIANGNNPTFTGTLATLQPGFHILYAYSGDGQEATSTQPSPATGAIQAYGFLVTASSTLLPQTVAFANLPTLAGTGSSVTLSAMASTPVTFTSASAICAVSGSTLTFNTPGICTVTATAAQTSLYQSAAIFENITVLPGQTITFGNLPPQPMGTRMALTGTASSGLAITYATSNGSICSVTESEAYFLAPGTCTITASQYGNYAYYPAAPVTQSFPVTQGSGLGFIPVTPCRLVDTRLADGPFGGPTLTGGSTRIFPLPNASCGLPSNASAYSLNITAVPPAPLGYLTVYPTGGFQPFVATLNSSDGRIVGNAAIVAAGQYGGINVFVTNQTDIVIDVNGYFAPIETAGALSFAAVTPCRVADTRAAAGPFGGPTLAGGDTRSFAFPASTCSIPSTAAAYSVNAAVVPSSTLGYLTLYPAGTPQPFVSSLNDNLGLVVSNAAIVPSGANGAIEAFATNQTDLILDINGYFASAPPNPTVFNVVTPCRVVDTRLANGTFGGPIIPGFGTRTFPIPASSCGIPSTATAYAVNVTAVPSYELGYLTIWPAGETQPFVATLNAPGGQIVGNAAIVKAGTNGAVNVYVTNDSHVVIDIVGYFSAP